MLKVWRWYRNLTKEQFESTQNLSVQDKYPLYAFTNNKEFRKLFKEMRKKEAFIELHSKMTEDEFRQFANTNRGNMLDMYKYAKIVGREGKEPILKDVEVLTTWDEKEYTQSFIEQFADTGSSMGIQNYPFPPMIFKQKYFNAISTIQYTAFWSMYSTQQIPARWEDMLEELGFELDYDYPVLQYDEFAIFVSLFGDLLKL